MLLAWGVQGAHRYFFRQAYVDLDVHLAMAQQALQGRAARLPEVAGPGPDDVVLLPMPDLMPGLTWMIAGVWRLVGEPYLAVWCIELAAIAALLAWLLKVYLRFAGHTAAGIWYYIGFLAFSFTPWRYLSASDLTALAAFVWAVWLTVHFVESGRCGALAGALALSLFAFWVRYAYLPMVLALPGVAVAYAWLFSGVGRKLALVWLTLAAAAVGAWVGYDYFSQTQTYLYTGEPAWYIRHLLFIDPFPVKAFAYLAWPHMVALALRTGLPYLAINAGLWAVSLFIVIWYLRQFAWKTSQYAQVYHVLTLLVIAVNMGMLAYISARNQAQDWNRLGFFTFIMETRYFAPSIALLLPLGWAAMARQKNRILVFMCAAGAIIPFLAQVVRMQIPPLQAGDWRAHESRQVLPKARALSEDAAIPVIFTDLNNGWGPGAAGLPRVSPVLVRGLEGTYRLLVLRTHPARLLLPPGMRLVSSDTLYSGRVMEVWDPSP